MGLFGFGSDKKRKAKIINRLESADKPKESLLSIDLDDTFHEQSASAIAQIRKLRFHFIDITETVTTSLSPSSVFAIEIEEKSVTAAIASRKGAFLDIKHLKRYTYEDLHAIYESVVGKEVEYDPVWLQTFENILVILTHDILYTLPSDILLIDNRHGDFQKITIPHSKFNDKEAAQNMLRKKIRQLSGYDADEIYMSSCERILTKKKQDNESVFAVSIVEKAYYDEIEEYLGSSDFRFRRLYSMYALLYASFEVGEAETVLRVHVTGETAYVVEKYKEKGFENMEFDLSEEYDSLLLMAYGAHELTLSGSGAYYERLKEKLSSPDADAVSYGEHKVKIRSFSYASDLSKAIIRTEREIGLEGGDAAIVSAVYLALFGQEFTPHVPGVTKQVTLYNYIHKNLKVLPFVILFVVLLLVYGSYLYLGKELKSLKEANSETARLVSEQKKLQKNIKLLQSNIKKRENENKRLERLFGSRTESEDAEILHEIAQKLPDDMILTKIEKRSIASHRGKRKRKKAEGVSAIVITGKCYHESSLLVYIKSLQIKGKRVFLVSLKDDMKKLKKMKEEESFDSVLFGERGEGNRYPQYAGVGGVHQLNGPKADGEDAARTLKRAEEYPRVVRPGAGISQRYQSKQKKIYYSDTINNTFVLEIR